MSLKWPVLCRVGHKTVTTSIYHCTQCDQGICTLCYPWLIACLSALEMSIFFSWSGVQTSGFTLHLLYFNLELTCSVGCYWSAGRRCCKPARCQCCEHSHERRRRAESCSGNCRQRGGTASSVDAHGRTHGSKHRPACYVRNWRKNACAVNHRCQCASTSRAC